MVKELGKTSQMSLRHLGVSVRSTKVVHEPQHLEVLIQVHQFMDILKIEDTA